MTTKDEALKLALEALEKTADWGDSEPVRRAHCLQAIAAIREALEQPQPDPFAHLSDADLMAMQPSAQPQQEPAAWYEMEGSEAHLYWRDSSGADVYDHITHYQKDRHGVGVFPLYTAPPRREWVSLTDDEIYPMYSEPSSDAEMVEFARAIEARLKEKNDS